ncbi:MAG: alpha/beta fold hydrolase, partial [Spirulina sp.]
VQGALFPVAIYCTQKFPQFIKGLVLAGPPAWTLMTTPVSLGPKKFIWNLLASPFGWGFYRYARRRQFLQSFSIRQLFDRPEDVDDEWLETLQVGAKAMASRHAVFAFLAGFWREDYQDAIAAISQPTLAIFGEKASSISRSGKTENPDRRLESYLQHFPHIQGCKIIGRNVLPYESPREFVRVVSEFIQTL